MLTHSMTKLVDGYAKIALVRRCGLLPQLLYVCQSGFGDYWAPRDLSNVTVATQKMELALHGMPLLQWSGLHFEGLLPIASPSLFSTFGGSCDGQASLHSKMEASINELLFRIHSTCTHDYAALEVRRGDDPKVACNPCMDSHVHGLALNRWLGRIG